MANILPDLTAAGRSSRFSGTTAYSLPADCTSTPSASGSTGNQPGQPRLRRKLGDPPVISTTPGVGYRITP
jgi:hypothetical protein